jgi:aminomethyltransferase
MGEVLIQGTGAEAFLNSMLTNDLRKLEAGQGQYTLMCNEKGGVVDDLYAYRLGQQDYMLIINASRAEADVEWLERNLGRQARRGEVKLQNVSDAVGAVAVQGPTVSKFIEGCFTGSSTGGRLFGKVTALKKNEVGQFDFGGENMWVSRTGYTGEDGFEVVAPAEVIEAVWNKLLAVGEAHGLKPAGLGARDTLRTEKCYPLYGHELDEKTTPIEAGLGFFVALDKGEFMGRATLAEQKAKGVGKKLAAFKMSEKSAPPRPGYAIWSAVTNGAKIGEVASGTQSPSLGSGIGMGYVPPEFAKAETLIEIEIRGKRAKAVVVPKPIYRKAD